MIDRTTDEITFLGDVFLPEAVTANLPYNHIVINLESPITNGDDGAPGKINLKARDNHLYSVFGNDLIGVCLANNHICDYGAHGFSDTLKHLHSMGLVWFGAGRTPDEAMAPCLVEVSGKKLALIGYVCPTTSPIEATDQQPGVALIDRSRIKASITQARNAGADLVVVSFHWGAEHVPIPTIKDVDIARLTVDDGADLVVGHHAHCIQSYEIYNGKYIFFGIGNCIFPDLNAPSNYDLVDKKPTGRFQVKQEYWNKTSLAIRMNVITGAVRIDKLRFSKNTLTVLKTDYRPSKLAYGSGKSYPIVFHIVFFAAKLRRVFMSFVREPKVPRLKHVRSIVNLARSRNYK